MDSELLRAVERVARELLALGAHSIQLNLDGKPCSIKVTDLNSQLTECDRDCLQTIAASQLPITTSRILASLDQQGKLHGERTVKRSLSKLARHGLIIPSRCAPRGYRLAAPLQP